MDHQQIAAILEDDVTRGLIERQPTVRVAYTGRDGAPRVVPVAYVVEDGAFVFCTIPGSAKVAALEADPRVALTIDTQQPQLCCLLVRGTATVETVDGVPPEYLAASFRTMPPEAHADFENNVRAMYDSMVKVTITPTFVRLNDFVRTAPRAVEQIMAEKAGSA